MNPDRILRGLWPALLSIILLSSCTRVRIEPPGRIETGVASWYGPGFHGRTTSNREIYDMYDMTAAHRELPFGSHVMVTNLDNQRSVVVRINDRGPFVKGRIIDLSYAAARMLEMVEPGTARVRIELIPEMSPDPGDARFSVQVGSFSNESNARDLLRRMKNRYPEAYISAFKTGRQAYHRVRIRARSREDAMRLARRLRDEGFPVLVLEDG